MWYSFINYTHFYLYNAPVNFYPVGDHFGQIILIRPDQIIWGDKLFRETGRCVFSDHKKFKA